MSSLENDAFGAGLAPEMLGDEMLGDERLGDERLDDRTRAAAGEVRDGYDGDILDRATDCALELAADRPWGEISLRDIAIASGVGFAELYARADGKSALLDHLSRRLDGAAFDSGETDDGAELHDRLFEAVMARLEAMAPHRAALIAIARVQQVRVHVALRLPRTARALLEASGIDTGGARGALRVAAMTRVWARVLQVWRDDQGALNRTMAEIKAWLSPRQAC